VTVRHDQESVRRLQRGRVRGSEQGSVDSWMHIHPRRAPEGPGRWVPRRWVSAWTLLAFWPSRRPSQLRPASPCSLRQPSAWGRLLG